MADRRRFSGRRAGGWRPPSEWEAVNAVGLTALAASTKAIVASFTVSGPSQTVRRVRGNVFISSDQVLASEFVVGAFGLMVASEDAFTAGAASIPGPFTDAGSDLWLVHRYFAHSFQFISGVGAGLGDSFGVQLDIDSKAMRKVTEEERLVVMIENGSANGMVFNVALRVLSTLSRA